MNNTPDHPDFTALALGEHIHGTPARAVLDALRTSVAARQEAEQLRATASQLSLVLKGQPPQRLDNKRRQAIFNADVAALRERFAAEEREEEAVPWEPAARVVVQRRRSRTAWMYPTAVAAAVAAAVVAVLRLLPGTNGPVNTPSPVVKTDAAGTAGRIAISTPATDASAQRSRVPGVSAVPVPVVAHQENTTPPSQETVHSVPATDSPAPVVVHESQKPQPDAVPEVAPAKPPFRNDLRDYASPPRVPQKGK